MPPTILEDQEPILHKNGRYLHCQTNPCCLTAQNLILLCIFLVFFQRGWEHQTCSSKPSHPCGKPWFWGPVWAAVSGGHPALRDLENARTQENHMLTDHYSDFFFPKLRVKEKKSKWKSKSDRLTEAWILGISFSNLSWAKAFSIYLFKCLSFSVLESFVCVCVCV